MSMFYLCSQAFPPSSFDYLQYDKSEGEGLVHFYHMNLWVVELVGEEVPHMS